MPNIYVQFFDVYEVFEQGIHKIVMFILMTITLETNGTVYIIDSTNRNNNNVVFIAVYALGNMNHFPFNDTQTVIKLRCKPIIQGAHL